MLLSFEISEKIKLICFSLQIFSTSLIIALKYPFFFICNLVKLNAKFSSPSEQPNILQTL